MAAVTAAFLTCRRIVCPRCRRRHFTQPALLVEHLLVCGVQEEVPGVVPGAEQEGRRHQGQGPGGLGTDNKSNMKICFTRANLN